MINKPKLWKYKSGIKKGKLRPKAKQYLSFKLKQYYKKRTERMLKFVEPNFIRVWAKFSYRGKKPLFVESYIDGKAKNEDNLRNALLDLIASAFGEEVAFRAEIGIERITSITNRTIEIRYRRSERDNWRTL